MSSDHSRTRRGRTSDATIIIRAVRYAPEIVEIVSHGTTPTIVPDNLIESLQAWAGSAVDIITLQPEEPVHQIVSKHVNAVEQVTATIDAVDVADVIMDDLERLSKLKTTFENLFMEYPRPEKRREESSEEKDSIATPAATGGSGACPSPPDRVPGRADSLPRRARKACVRFPTSSPPGAVRCGRLTFVKRPFCYVPVFSFHLLR